MASNPWQSDRVGAAYQDVGTLHKAVALGGDIPAAKPERALEVMARVRAARARVMALRERQRTAAVLARYASVLDADQVAAGKDDMEWFASSLAKVADNCTEVQSAIKSTGASSPSLRLRPELQPSLQRIAECMASGIAYSQHNGNGSLISTDGAAASPALERAAAQTRIALESQRAHHLAVRSLRSAAQRVQESYAQRATALVQTQHSNV